jgi:hypothetical protein
MTLANAKAAPDPIAAGEETAITPQQTGSMHCALAR